MWIYHIFPAVFIDKFFKNRTSEESEKEGKQSSTIIGEITRMCLPFSARSHLQKDLMLLYIHVSIVLKYTGQKF